jgi:hypothetical protein
MLGFRAITALFALIGVSTAVSPVAAQNPNAAAISVSAERYDGTEAIDASGTAAPSSMIELVLKAKLSWDLPLVTLNRMLVPTDEQGRFSVRMPLAPNYVETSVFYLEALGTQGELGHAAFTAGRLYNGKPIPLTDNENYGEYPPHPFGP